MDWDRDRGGVLQNCEEEDRGRVESEEVVLME
jgi:hypothetical protein